MRIFRIVLNWENYGSNDTVYHNLFGDSMRISYDGYCVLMEDSKIIGYTDDGILSGAAGEITENRKDFYQVFPFGNCDLIEDHIRLSFNREHGQILLTFFEEQYSVERAQIVIQRAFKKSEMFSMEIQQAFKKFYLA